MDSLSLNVFPLPLFLLVAEKRGGADPCQHESQTGDLKKTQKNGFQPIPKGDSQISGVDPCEKGSQGQNRAEYRVDQEEQNQVG